MNVRFWLGPAGCGKTRRCLEEARRALAQAPDGPALLFIAPKQATYQLERQILGEGALAGYTRLKILSFDRLAAHVFERLGLPEPELLDEEGRLMVLRGLLARRRGELRLFRASARLTGFARQLSLALRELQRQQIGQAALRALAGGASGSPALAAKLHDLGTMLGHYLAWLAERGLQDAECLLDNAAAALAGPAAEGIWFDEVWVDGFVEWSPQELGLLAALLPRCRRAAVTFCLEAAPPGGDSWLSPWSAARSSFDEARRRLGALTDTGLTIEVLPRQGTAGGRFQGNPVLDHLERYWASPQPAAGPAAEPASLARAVRVALCNDPEAEADVAAREILRHARAGGRFREVAVLARDPALYHDPLQRVFGRYGIPLFMDRRESVAHHPLAELTRSALRTVVHGWQRDDWFAALKTGLAGAGEREIDSLENEALARGWHGAAWRQPIRLPAAGRPDQEARQRAWEAELERLRLRLVPPFERLSLALARANQQPTGPALAEALRTFWADLEVPRQLAEWAAAGTARAGGGRPPGAVHATVWEQMNTWLANLELAFPNEALPAREWLPILDAGLANLSVGVIPPALDQVLFGAIDRSRHPEIRLALVLGLNEGVFPAPPDGSVLLTDADRTELEQRGVRLGPTARRQIARERFHAYTACTRARGRLVLTAARRNADGAALNPSPFLAHLRRIFPQLEIEEITGAPDWRESEHLGGLMAPLLQSRWPDAVPTTPLPAGETPPPQRWLTDLPGLASILDRLRHFQTPDLAARLDPALADRLYGPALRSSVSRLEQFAACPFQFFVHSGLRAEERQRFELDRREEGSFQHDALAQFHEELRRQGRRWRDLTPAEARTRIAAVARALSATYHEGLLQTGGQSRFLAERMIESLQDFVETIVAWMRGQYQFDPVQVELPFGGDQASPAWTIPLEGGRRLELQGRIDRVDLCPVRDGSALCVVIDYKSSEKKLDPLLVANGLQLQLPAYLNVLRRWPAPRALFGVDRLVPAGVFYVNLRGRFERGKDRREALADPAADQRQAYRHAGRLDASALDRLDARVGVVTGDQFNFRITKSGQVHKGSREVMASGDFLALLDATEAALRRMGARIFAGDAAVLPYRKGAETACQRCDYQAICRMDPWIHPFRTLDRPADGGAGPDTDP